MLKLSRRISTARETAERLHRSAVAQARLPDLYADLGAPDSVEGRFELLSVHVILLLLRLGGEPGLAAEVRQALFDTFVSHLDGAMREMGVGDLAMAKRMRRLGEAFYGRLQAYSDAVASLPDTAGLREVVARTILDGSSAWSDLLADHLARTYYSLLAQDLHALLTAEPSWGTR